MSDAEKLYKQKWYHMIMVGLVLVGGLNWLSAVFLKGDALSTLFGKGVFTKLIYLAVGISALLLFFDRNMYLPFLGETVLPCAAFATRTPDNANQEVTITTIPNAKVIYWASEPRVDASDNSVATWDVAYNTYSNSGVTISDESGKAILKYRGQPQSYKVPYKGVLKPHVHFRVCEKNGMVGPVQTYFIHNGTIEKMMNYI
jgi:uncharacterized membrane protein YuzA (DUF378 family)